MKLDGEIALVTGASRGIGKAIALRLGQLGANVIGTATSDNGAQAISDYLAENSVKGTGLKLDVNNDDDIKQLLDSINADYGSVSILINNAGITRDNLFLLMKNDQWQEIIDTNLTSVYKMSKACIRAMTKARKGRIINITSVVAVTGNPGQVNYCASKAGMIGFTKSLAQEIASRNITVNAVAPGFIDTDMTSELNDKAKQAILATIPMKKLGLPDDIAAAVAFLASSEADYITGTTLHVNGGMFMN